MAVTLHKIGRSLCYMVNRRTKLSVAAVLAVASATLAFVWISLMPPLAADAAGVSARETLKAARSWGYQLDEPDPAKLAHAACDLLVIDYSRDGSEDGAFRPSDIDRMRGDTGKGGRVVVAYLSVGEAEDYRFYWQDAWSHPRGRPAWITDENEEWRGNYQVEYWDPAWQGIIFGSPDSYVDKVIAAGFDGIFLDRVDAYLHWDDRRHSARHDMIAFVRAIAEYARAKKKDFVVMVQNGEDLLDHTDYVEAIDGVAKEDLFFGAYGSGRRNSKEETMTSLRQLAMAQARGLPVFLVEYIRSPRKISEVRGRAGELGLIPAFADRALKKPPECNFQ